MGGGIPIASNDASDDVYQLAGTVPCAGSKGKTDDSLG